MQRFLKQAVALGAAVLFAACDTAEGLGRDLQDAGEAIEDAAEDAQENGRDR